MWQHIGGVVSATTSQLEGPLIESRLAERVRVELCSPRACIDFLQVLWFPPTVHTLSSVNW